MIYIQILKLLAAVFAFSSQITPTYTQGVLYYGFFFDAATASSIKALTDYYLNTTLQQVPEFSQFLNASATPHNITEPMNYFSKPLDPNTEEFDPFYHVTTKFCGNGINCTSYANQVSTSLNKTFEMQIIGLYFTNRTFGLRVQLTADQEKLFDNTRIISTDLPTIPLNESLKYLNTNTYYTSLIDISASYPSLSFSPQPQNFHPTTNNPHITIGCAPGIPAVITGTDLLDIISYEASFNSTPNFNLTVTLPGGIYTDQIIKYQNTFVFVIYPHMKIIANATFLPYFLPSDNSPAASFISHPIIPFLYITLITFVFALLTKIH